ncbi:hypothetical protein DV113_003335 [Geotrichum candidum]|nr:hypothetical protein DV113_003335 [Geotrichum candidum]
MRGLVNQTGSDDENGEKKKKKNLNIMATGGGSYKFYDLMRDKLNVQVQREDEMECLIAGLDFFITEIPEEVFCYSEQDPMSFAEARPNIYPYLLVNIGSGVSMIKVIGPNNFVRIGGSSLGGGTLWGLLSLLTDAKSYDDMLEMAGRGDNTKVDMLVGDIYGGEYSRIGLKSSTIASSFGKVFKQVRRRQAEEEAQNNADHHDVDQHGLNQEGSEDAPTKDGNSSESSKSSKSFDEFKGEDISRSLLYAISNNIGQIAYLQARYHGLEHIYFGGSYICGHPITMHTLSYAINFWSQGEKTAYFLRHEGYLGAVGAFLRHQPSGWGRRNSQGYEDVKAQAKLFKNNNS